MLSWLPADVVQIVAVRLSLRAISPSDERK